VGKRGLREPDWIASSENSDSDCSSWTEEILRKAKDCEQAGGSKGADQKARREDVVSRDVPERAEQDVGDRRVRIGEVRDEPAVAIKIQRSWNVIAGFVPEVRETEKRDVRERDGGEEEREDNEVGERGEACGGDAEF